MDFGRFGQGVVKLLGKRLMKEPDDASDYIATIDADLGHDATDALSRIAAPTLVIAGSRDFFPHPARHSPSCWTRWVTATRGGA